jgi:hypothetical protein
LKRGVFIIIPMKICREILVLLQRGRHDETKRRISAVCLTKGAIVRENALWKICVRCTLLTLSDPVVALF